MIVFKVRAILFDSFVLNGRKGLINSIGLFIVHNRLFNFTYEQRITERYIRVCFNLSRFFIILQVNNFYISIVTEPYNYQSFFLHYIVLKCNENM